MTMNTSRPLDRGDGMSGLADRLRTKASWLNGCGYIASAEHMREAADALDAQAKEIEALKAARPVFHRMMDGRDAGQEAERRIEEILGVDLLGISFDDYDASIEIYPLDGNADVLLSDEQHAAIKALGCSRYWINFADGTERYCNGERKPSAIPGRWERHNMGRERRRKDENEIAALRAEVEALRRPGYVLVPREPTEDMLFAAETSGARGYSALYRAMIDAAMAAQEKQR